ncbi:MAG TPA: hypothetical protein V6C72_00715, partial [Chroococcales cyanobacterium]
MNQGVIRYLKDLVLHVEFDEKLPDVNELLVVDNEQQTPLLVDSVRDANTVICLNISGDRRLQKGMKAARTGQSIDIPVGDQLIGRVLDALGRPIDGKEPITDPNVPRRNIFRPPAQGNSFVGAKPEILETGIKVIDFFAPFVKGRKIGIIGGAGVGKTV